MSSSKILRTLAYLPLLALPFFASAHAVGESYNAQSGSYIVDVGYSTKQAAAGESVQFDFLLHPTSSPTDSSPFTDAWVTVTSKDTNAVVLATGVYNNDFGGPRLSYVFPGPGTFIVDARYEDSTTTLAEGSFPVTVLPPPRSIFTGATAIALALGAALGLVVALALLRSRSR